MAQISFKEAVMRTLTQEYGNFNGRTSSMAFWWYILFTLLVSILIYAGIMAFGNGFAYVGYAINLLLLLPTLGIEVRRLHDIGKSGWWILLSFIPLVGIIILIVWWCKPSQPGNNQYGPEPTL